MNLKNIPLTAILAGNAVYITSLEEKYVYKDNVKTEQTYFKARVINPSNRYEAFDVSIETLQGFPYQDNEYIGQRCSEQNPIQVEFIDAICSFYTDFRTKETKMSVKAKGIKAIESK